MINKKIYSIILLVFFSLLIASNGGLELIHADKSIGAMIEDERVNISTGHVHFRQDTIDMYCDESRFYDKQNRAEFIGSVLIDDGENTIRARQVDYYGNDHLAVCTGNVRIRTAGDSLYAEYFTYNFETGKAFGRKNLYIYNLKDNTTITGNEGVYDRQSGFSIIKNNCNLTRIDTSNGDTLIITSGQMEYHQDPEKRAIAVDSVQIIQGELTAKCDTAKYYPDAEVIWLIKEPKAWYGLSKMTGDRMQVDIDSMQLNNITIYDNAVAENQVDSVSSDYNRLTAKHIYIFVENKNIKKIKAVDNASSIYYLLQEGEKQGSNYATADTIFVYFEAGELESIDVIGGARGVFYPQHYKGEKGFE